MPCKLLLAGATAVLLASGAPPAKAQTTLPSDARPTCVVSADELKTRFVGNTVAANGPVGPADSLAFQATSECAFYKWSQRMFLWLTSPATPGAKELVFQSPIFFDVSPPDKDGKRTLVPNEPGKARNLSPSIPQRGPLKKPVVFDRTGKMFTLVRPEVGPSGKAVIRDKAGNKIEIARTEVAPDGKPIFLDKAGKAILPQVMGAGNLRLSDASGKSMEVRPKAVVLNGRPFLLNTAGEAVDLELGQADANALMAQGGSLVYYAIQVNDVFAYMATGVQTGAIAPRPPQFPTTGAELDKITRFALSQGRPLPDANALAIEVKSSWIEVEGLDARRFATITAWIPTFDRSNPSRWVVNGSKKTQLALVGIHVVGSTAGHPEMIWATIEHVDNTPSESYTYTDSRGAQRTVAKSAGRTWLFSGGGGGEPNVARMRVDGEDIVADAGTIGPSDVLRTSPWGSDPRDARTNTDVIAINNSIIGQLAAGDVRKNYIMTGSTWLKNGADAGTRSAANTTMETFFQPSNCLSCHVSSKVGVSHVYNDLRPLPSR